MTSPKSLTPIVWLLLCVIWGTTWLVIKVGLNDLPPIGFAAARFSLASLLLFAILRVQGVPIPRDAHSWQLMAVTGVMQFSINYSLIFWGELHISSGLAAVLQATIPMFGLLLGLIWLPSERFTPRKALAVAAGIAGVAVIFTDQLGVQNAMAFWGSAGVVVSAYMAAQASVLVKARGTALHPAALLFGQMICGLPPIVAYSFLVEGNPLAFHWTFRAIMCVLYLTVVGTIVAFWLYYWLLGKVESTQAMMIAVVTPLVAVLVGWWILDERLPEQTIWGGLLVIVSIGVIAIRPRVRQSPLPSVR